MNKIVYYVAISLDGYIAGPNNDISRFSMKSNGVEQYLLDLKDYKTVILGRRTYESGYQYGLKPGQPAYPHMDHFIFSETLVLDNLASNVHVKKSNIDLIKKIRDDSETDVYLCGGGEFAGWLLDHGMIDTLKLKLNPIILGDGIPLFGKSMTAVNLELVEKQDYSEGLQIITYSITKSV